jgi:hypothetical protein
MGSNVIDPPRNQPGTEYPQQKAEAARFSGTGQIICHWGALVLLTAASAYLIHLQFTYPDRCAQPVNDPFGIVTPPWLMMPLPPLAVAGSLGHAFWLAMRGRQCWKWILAAAAFAGVLASGELLGTCV